MTLKVVKPMAIHIFLAYLLASYRAGMMRGTSTGAMMRTLVFWAVFALYLAPCLEGQHNFEFGDMISVARGGRIRPLFTHWAIYVGQGMVDGLEEKRDDKDLFHINSVSTFRLSNCVFGKVGRGHYNKSNYLDGKYHIKSREYMIQKINELHHNCSRWNPRSHNCEHVATSIRYGFEHCEQSGTMLEGRLRFRSERPANMGKRSLIQLFRDESSLTAAGA